jgi:hypothetical protein
VSWAPAFRELRPCHLRGRDRRRAAGRLDLVLLGMSDEWERVSNQQIQPGDYIELDHGAQGEVVSVAQGPEGSLLVEVDLRYPVAGGPDSVNTDGTYALPAEGQTRRRRAE